MEIVAFILSILNFLLILIGWLFVKHHLPSYLMEKGKNLATKEDIELITHKVESIRTQYAADMERLKSSLTLTVQLLEKRRQVYEEIAQLMRVFLSGHPAEANEKDRFLSAYATAWLWASDGVVQSLNRFLELQSVHFKNPGSINQEDMKKAYATCVLEMRKSAGFPETGVDREEYKFVTF